MENKIKVGEYCRTKNGLIAKLIEPQVYEINDEECIEFLEDIVKHSSNLIDLIQCGDYVNGHKVIDASDTNKGCMREVYCEDDEDFGLWNEHINTIVTKEQMKSVEYIVKEEQ